MQLIREDLQDLEHDKLRGTNNIIWLLEKKLKSKNKVNEKIIQAINKLKEETTNSFGGKLNYLKEIIEKEEKQIKEMKSKK